MASQGYHYSPYSNLSSDPPTQMAAPQQQPANLTVGHCMYCKSPLCYPDNITVFRCTTCDTINDLAPIPVPASSEPLSLQNINEKILFCQQRYTSYAVDYMPLEKYLREHLSSLAAINACFSTNQPATKDHCGVDLEQTRAAFKALARLPPISGITNAVSKAFDGLLQRPGRDITGTNDLKFIMIMLECPWLSRNNGKEETELHHTILKRLFTITSNLHPDHHRVLRQWFSTTLPKEIFTNRVNLINKFITKRLSVQQNSVPPRQYRNDPRIKAAARVMQLFFLANHSNEISQTSGRGDANYVIVPSYKDLGRPAKLIQLDEFYNTMVDIIDLPYDFATWEDRGAPFTFCNYPFLISMGSKMQIMSWDAKRQMELEKETTIKKLLQQRKRDSPDTHSITLTAMEIQQAQLITLYVNRSNLIAESLTQLSEKQSALKKALRIVFIGEDGIDAGGLRKEWFLLLVRQLFDPQYGMFVYDDDSQYCWFNPSSFESLGEFYLVGIVIGLAIYNSTILDLPLPTAVYKKLLNVPLTLEDLAQFRPGLASGFQDLLKYEGDDVEDVFCVDFTMSYEYFGEPIVAPLVPGGAQKPVTKDNKEEYVERYANYVMNDSITDQFEYFRKGFYLVCGGGALSLFRPEEIEYLVRGSEEPLDIDTLRSVTVYEGFQDDHDVIKNFWSIFKEMESKEQRRLLQFITASDRYPATGISNLTFKITCIGATDSDRFPTTHTCFNQLCLYNYTGREKLKRMLTRAMNESEGFGVK